MSTYQYKTYRPYPGRLIAADGTVIAETMPGPASHHEPPDPTFWNLAEEAEFEIFLNGTPVCTAICTPCQLEELAAGRLLTEGLLTEMLLTEESPGSEAPLPASGIREIQIKEGKILVNTVSSSESSIVPERRTAPHGTTVSAPAASLSPVTPIPWNRSTAAFLMKSLTRGLELHLQTFAVHAAMLVQEEKILCTAEDLGRHNALDKVIGHAVLHGTDLRKCMLFTSGRMPTDMVRKAIRAQVPVLVGKGAPTVQAAELAAAHRLELVRSLPGGRFMVYT